MENKVLELTDVPNITLSFLFAIFVIFLDTSRITTVTDRRLLVKGSIEMFATTLSTPSKC